VRYKRSQIGGKVQLKLIKKALKAHPELSVWFKKGGSKDANGEEVYDSYDIFWGSEHLFRIADKIIEVQMDDGRVLAAMPVWIVEGVRAHSVGRTDVLSLDYVNSSKELREVIMALAPESYRKAMLTMAFKDPEWAQGKYWKGWFNAVMEAEKAQGGQHVIED